MKEISILGRKLTHINGKKIWAGTFVSPLIVGIYEIDENSIVTIQNFKVRNSDLSETSSEILNEIDKVKLRVIEFDNQYKQSNNLLENLEPTRYIKIKCGPIDKITKKLKYIPLITINAQSYKIMWEWVVFVKYSTPEGCDALPGDIQIYDKDNEKGVLISKKDESLKWEYAYKSIQKAIGEDPKETVVYMLLDEINIF